MGTSNSKRRGTQVHLHGKNKRAAWTPTGKREQGQKNTNRPKRRRAHVYQYAKKERGIRDPANYGLEAHVHQQAKLGEGRNRYQEAKNKRGKPARDKQRHTSRARKERVTGKPASKVKWGEEIPPASKGDEGF